MQDLEIEVPKILPPTDDHVFKTLLTHPNAKPVLIDVISTAIERKVVSAEIRNNEIPISDTNEKKERLDVNCTIDGGDQVNVEMQASRIEEIADDHKNLKNKAVYYMTDLHSSQKSTGLKYLDMVKTYQITFCSYTVFPERSDFVCRSAMRTDTGELISDQLNMIIIELSKLNEALKKPTDNLTPIEMWSLYLKYASDPKYAGLLNEITKKKEEIRMATALLNEISQNEDERAKFRSRRKFETDTYSNLATAEMRGEMRGMAKLIDFLRKGGSLDDAERMLAVGN